MCDGLRDVRLAKGCVFSQGMCDWPRNVTGLGMYLAEGPVNCRGMCDWSRCMQTLWHVIPIGAVFGGEEVGEHGLIEAMCQLQAKWHDIHLKVLLH